MNMKSQTLFYDHTGKTITVADFSNALERLGAYDCDILYIHTGLNFGMPDPSLGRTELLNNLLEIIYDLNVPTLCMPTYTFSFCNGRDYDRLTSKSRMGAINEHFRMQPDVLRSKDPLMSVALRGRDMSIIEDVGIESCGKDSSFDILHRKSRVKFLFLGPKIGDCFTYMHYLEWLYGVDYRYNRSFFGRVIENGKTINKESVLFVRYNGIAPNNGSYEYEEEMYRRGLGLKISLGNATISIVGERDAADCYKEFLEKDPYFFVDREPMFEKRDKTFILTREMVAL